MGGYGSGRRLSNPKRAVEDGLTLRIRVFRESIQAIESGAMVWRGTLTWSRLGTTTAEVGTAVRWAERDDGARAPEIILSYRRTPPTGEPVDVRTVVRTCATAPGFGGLRRWFVCPGLAGRPCGRRVGCLYLPPGSWRFACRECHRLTYRSRQESRKYDGLFRRIAAQTGTSPADVRRVLSQW